MKQQLILNILSIRYFNEVMRPLVLILPKMSGNDQTFKNKDGVISGVSESE